MACKENELILGRDDGPTMPIFKFKKDEADAMMGKYKAVKHEYEGVYSGVAPGKVIGNDSDHSSEISEAEKELLYGDSDIEMEKTDVVKKVKYATKGGIKRESTGYSIEDVRAAYGG